MAETKIALKRNDSRREIKVYGKIILLLIAATAILHIIAIFTGLYKGKVWIDIPQHILSGMMLGFLWLVLTPTQKSFNKYVLFISTVSFAVLGSFLWEVFEFTLLQLFPTLAETAKLYSRTLEDALSDMFYGFLGGIITAVIAMLRKKN